MSKMSELHYEREQEMQEDCPYIEYHMKYPEKTRWTPSIRNWYNKKYEIKSIKNYIKARKVRLPF